MVFSSLSFLFVFLPALLLFYYCPLWKGRSLRNGILLLASLGFYACGGLRLLPIILASIALNYLFGRLVSEKQSPQRRRFGLMMAVIGNLGILIVFKYLGFLTENLQTFFPSLPLVSIVLPIGISFYTFQGLSYVIDVYRGAAKAQHNILNLALYIALFPQLIAGPIVRYHTIATEIAHRQERLDHVADGLLRFLFGLAKKVLLSNQMALVADGAFQQSPDLLSSGVAWLGLLAYTLQIYFDFSGYSDMAIGLGGMFGFHFEENFNYPYISQSITEFWRRWHMSLGTWFRDYLYIPLGGNRGNKVFQIRNLLIVWTLTGFWHGAAWNFLLWGLFYGLLLMGERYLWQHLLVRLPRVLRHGYALFLIMLGWLLFRATDLAQIQHFLTALFGLSPAGLWSDQATYFLLQFRWEWLLSLLAAMPIKVLVQEFFAKREASPLCRSVEIVFPRALALLLGGLSCCQLISSGFNPFIYFQF